MSPLVLAIGGIVLVLIDNAVKPLSLATTYGIILLTVAAAIYF